MHLASFAEKARVTEASMISFSWGEKGPVLQFPGEGCAFTPLPCLLPTIPRDGWLSFGCLKPPRALQQASLLPPRHSGEGEEVLVQFVPGVALSGASISYPVAFSRKCA